jgi:hypothetical protein
VEIAMEVKYISDGRRKHTGKRAEDLYRKVIT